MELKMNTCLSLLRRYQSFFRIVLICLFLASPISSIANTIKANGITMYYELHGNNKNVPIVLVAGFASDHTFWSGIVAKLAQTHQVLIFDNRRIGQSDTPDKEYSVDMMADDTMALISKLGLKKPIIVGQSMGSAITQSIGRRYSHEVSKLVLINTFSKINKAPEIAFEVTGQLLSMDLPLELRIKSIVPWVFSNEFLANNKNIETLLSTAKNNLHPQSSIGYQRQLGALKTFDSNLWLPEIKTPTLVIAAKEDLIAPQAIALEVANSIGSKPTLVMVPGGHASPIEQPQKITEAIHKFISE
jgi:pimeloyl-ACP methyl ester carboxylesterase